MLALCAPLDRQQFNETFTGAFSAQSPKVSGDFSCGSLKIHSSMGFGPMVFQLGAFNPRSSELYNSAFFVLKAGYNDLPLRVASGKSSDTPTDPFLAIPYGLSTHGGPFCALSSNLVRERKKAVVLRLQ
ncbi:hypothetical protein KL921_004509 [Ogataea angusta]|nr:hypothetical protein KL921_004509 [Ogataea angusta]